MPYGTFFTDLQRFACGAVRDGMGLILFLVIGLYSGAIGKNWFLGRQVTFAQSQYDTTRYDAIYLCVLKS